MARKVINITDTSFGFTTLWMLKRLDLSIEALVLKPEFKTLFTEDERALARASLKEYDCVAPGIHTHSCVAVVQVLEKQRGLR